MGRCLRRDAGRERHRHDRAQQEKPNEHRTPSRHGIGSLDAAPPRAQAAPCRIRGSAPAAWPPSGTASAPLGGRTPPFAA
jgi:hypothetical protein